MPGVRIAHQLNMDVSTPIKKARSVSPSVAAPDAPAPPSLPSPPLDLPNSLSLSPSSPSTLSVPTELEDAPAEQRVSYYVQAVDEMVSSVLSKEAFLFDSSELGALERFARLAYEARYLFIRLYLRKQRWIRVAGLKYQRDIEDLHGTVGMLTRREGEEDVVPAKEEEVEEREPVASTSRAKWDVIDLTEDDDEPLKMEPIDLTLSDSDEEEKQKPKPKPQPKKERSPSPVALGHAPPPEPDYSRLALGQADFLKSDTTEILAMLSLDEIVGLGRKLKVDPGKGKNSVSAVSCLLLAFQARPARC